MTEILVWITQNTGMTFLMGCFLLVVVKLPLDVVSEFINSKQAKLKTQNKYLLKENQVLRQLATSDSPTEERLRVLETIVTDGDFELNRRLLKAAQDKEDE